MKIRFMVDRNLATNSYGLHMVEELPSGVVYVATSMTMQQILEGAMLGAPVVSLSPTDIQGLMDELWSAGIRPAVTGNASGEKELAAVKLHLEDMRKIAMSYLELQK